MSCLGRGVLPLMKAVFVCIAVAACDQTGLDVIVRGAADAPIGITTGRETNTSDPSTEVPPLDDTSSDQSVDGTTADDASINDWETWGNGEPEMMDGGETTDAGVFRCTGSLSLDQTNYRIQARNTGCLTYGSAQSLPSPSGVRVSAMELLVGTDCIDDLDTRFRLIPGVGGWFELFHPAVQLNADVLFAEYEVGTPIVLYEPHGRSVQWFRFAPAREDFVTISPERDPDLCLERTGNEVELALCVPGQASQEWLLLGPDCDESTL